MRLHRDQARRPNKEAIESHGGAIRSFMRSNRSRRYPLDVVVRKAVSRHLSKKHEVSWPVCASILVLQVMKRYVIDRVRCLGEAPITHHSLLNWQFVVVTKGQCGVTLGNWKRLPLQKQCLWIFPPGFVHGWHGDDAECNTLSFELEEIPVQLFAAMKDMDYLSIELTPEQLAEIINMNAIIHPDFSAIDFVNELRFDRAIVQMSVIALETLTANATEIAHGRAEKRIQSAVECFRSNLTDRAAVRWKQTTKAAGVTSAKLRSMFVNIFNKPAHQLMKELQIEVSTELLENTSMPLDSFSAKTGFSS